MRQIQWYPGHMAKTKRQIRERLTQADLVFELLDARIPRSSANPLLREVIGQKPRLVLLHKADLAPKDALKAWLEYYKEIDVEALPTSSHAIDIKAVVAKATKICKNLLDKEARQGRNKRPLRAMIIGIPNVGKSTLINAVVHKKIVKVAPKAGTTRHLQVIRIHEDLELLDTPGVLWPKIESEDAAFRLALTGAIKDDILPLDDIVIYGLNFLKEKKPQALNTRYGITKAMDAVTMLDTIGLKRGCLLKGSAIDYQRVYEIFLHDFRNHAFGPVMLDEVPR